MATSTASQILKGTEFHEKKSSFRIKHDGDERFHTKLLSKETSKSQPSFRVYYGGVSGAVPFTWETTPGTPKHRSHDGYEVPPLTPPPSYYSNAADLVVGRRRCKRRKSSTSRSSKLLHQLLHALTLWRVAAVVHPKKDASPSTTSSLSLSSSSSSNSSGNSYRRRRTRFSSWGSSFDEEKAMAADPTHRSEEMGSSTAPEHSCFGGVKMVNAAKIRSGGGYYSSVKKAFSSVVGRKTQKIKNR